MWLVELQACPSSAALHQQWLAWRAADPQHEQAWQHVQSMSLRLAKLPSPLVHAALKHAGGKKTPSRRHAIKSFMVLLCVGSSAWMLRNEVAWHPLLADIQTATGERRTLHLSDGSVLELNTDTAIDVRLGETERLIRLVRGEIFLQTGDDAAYAVQHSKKRPLQVETQHGQLTALGTRFSVQYLKGATHTSVQVLDGRVRITPAAIAPNSNAPILESGQTAQFNVHHTLPVQVADERTLAWRHGMLIVQDMPLAMFIAELGRYHHSGRLVCDASATSVMVTGTFPTRDTAQVLHLLQATLPVRVETRQHLWGRHTTLVRLAS